MEDISYDLRIHEEVFVGLNGVLECFWEANGLSFLISNDDFPGLFVERLMPAVFLLLPRVLVVPKVGFDVLFLDAVEELGDKDDVIPGQTDFRPGR